MSVLFPEGIKHLGDLPHTLVDGITLGMQFLSFMELPKDEQPPRRMWFDGDRLKEHFAAVEKRREEKYGTDKDKPREIEDPVDNGFSLVGPE